MSDLLKDFNAGDVPRGDAGIPEKTQANCVVSKMTEEKTKDGTGIYFKAEIDVVEGPYKGKKIWQNYNVVNSNADAVQIGKAQFASLCLAMGVPSPRHLSELCNRPFRITFGKPKHNDFTGNEDSTIRKYDPVGGSDGVASGVIPQQGEKPSWAK